MSASKLTHVLKFLGFGSSMLNGVGVVVGITALTSFIICNNINE